MTKFKKLFLTATTLLCGVPSMFGCNPVQEEKEITDEELELSYKFEQIYGSAEENILEPNQEKIFDINDNLNNYNYLKLTLLSKKNLIGKFTYSNLNDETQIVSEDFFIEGSEQEINFKQFLDAFRTEVNPQVPGGKEMGIGNFKKKLLTVSFTNINEENVSFTLTGVYKSPRIIPAEEKEIYIIKNNLKVGMDLACGGTLTHLEKTNSNGKTVDEIVDDDGFVQIGPGIAGSGQEDISENGHVNLINIFDAGRQIQQSYYAGVGGTVGTSEETRQDRNQPDGGNLNGYTRNMCYTADSNGYYWPYNPVQGGDEIVNFSQIIDFKQTKSLLYCKVRALDWAAGKKGENRVGNRVTKSYIENWYEIKKDGMLYATNRFIDWNGFTDLESVPAHNLEIPATYIVHPLNNFITYTGNKPWDWGEDDIDFDADLDIQSSLGTWKYGSYRTDSHAEDWFAWVNGDPNHFGVGIYIPGARYYASGRSDKSSNIDVEINYGADDSPMAQQYRYNKAEPLSSYTSCYVRNTDYTAPVVTVKMKEYVPISYTYVVAVDYLKVFRKKFKKIATGDNPITNETLKNWD